MGVEDRRLLRRNKLRLYVRAHRGLEPINAPGLPATIAILEPINGPSRETDRGRKIIGDSGFWAKEKASPCDER
jgi:hypothetical protein